jgi:hypothetical protein
MFLWSKTARTLWSLLAATAIALLVPLTALAAEVQSGETVTIEPNQVVTDDLYAFGSNVIIQGTVQGDVIAAGSMVTISGHVTGDVMAAGNSVTVTGPVDGSVRIAGNLLSVAAPVNGDALMAGSMMTVNSTARVGRDALLAGATMNLQGPVVRDVKASGGKLTIASSVGGGVDARVNDLALTEAASVVGPVSYVSPHDAAVAPTTSVGALQRTAPPTTVNPWEVGGVDMLALVRGFVGMAALGLLLVLVFPRAASTTAATLQHEWLPSLSIGFGLLVATPIVAFIVFMLGLLVGGWWIGVMLLILCAMLALVGYLACAEWLGLAALRVAKAAVHPIWAVLLGLLILAVVSLIPVLGGIAVLAATVFGVGALTVSAWHAYRQAPPVAVAPTAAPTPTPLQAAA